MFVIKTPTHLFKTLHEDLLQCADAIYQWKFLTASMYLQIVLQNIDQLLNINSFIEFLATAGKIIYCTLHIIEK